MNTDHNERPVIYQLFVRTFGNTNSSRIPNGTLEENGCGKFHDISSVALTAIREMGFNHVWLSGVIEQASGTNYPNRPADPLDILKGKAGSPYAIRDYFDVCPDYAVEPNRRLEEFLELLDRCHQAGLRVIMDFIPNHVARSYGSDIRPDLSFGEGDNREVFFDRDNHFFYLNESHDGGGPPLKLPTLGMEGCSGSF
ncbi:MAG: alpha-amylase family glycosyl hydrolase, partial [Akkermansiaceae bacterium]